MRSLLLVLILGVTTLAGCSDDGAEPEGPGSLDDEAGDAAAAAQPLWMGDQGPPVSAMETFTGTFAFQDNRQFMGEAASHLGQDWTNIQLHDITHLVPVGVPSMLHIVGDADTGSGDLDVFFWVSDALAGWWCDCPFGGHNEIMAYATGEGGQVIIGVQFDEISTGPTDPGAPVEGFDYTVDVMVSGHGRMIPPGVPIALSLTNPGDHVRFENHTQPIVVYGPDDAILGTVDPGDNVYAFQNGSDAGEYVFLQRLDGTPMTATAWRADDTTPLRVRFLDVQYSETFQSIPDGEPGFMPFEAPPSVISVGGCGLGGDLEVDPSFRIVAPSGETWAAAADAGVSVLGWGACMSNWPGDAEQQPGTWSVEFADTAGHDRTLGHWLMWYVR